MPTIQRASRTNVRVRALFEGLSGSGKTATALILATAITKKYGGRIGVVDTQGRQSEAYADAPLPNGDTADFDIIDLPTGDPNAYISAINEFESTKSHSVIIVDSLTHAWTGRNGILEQKDKVEGKGPAVPWAVVTPLQNRFVEKLVTCKAHLIATVRVKTDTVWEKNSDGKVEGYKVGLKSIQKDGLEYEFQLHGVLDQSHTLRVHNARGIQALQGSILPTPNENLTRPILEWLETGKSSDDGPAIRIATPEMVGELTRLVAEKFGTSRTVQEQKFWEKYGVEMINAPFTQIGEALEKVKKSK